MTIIPKKEWIEEQKIKEAQFLKEGWTEREIQEAYKIAWRLRRVSYICKYDLEGARFILKTIRSN